MTKSYRFRKKPGRRREQKEHPFYPNHLLRVFMAIMGAVAFIATLSALFPLPLGYIADPLAQPDPGTRALWILKPVILLANMVPMPALTIVLIIALAALFVLLPVLDQSGQSSIKRRTLVAVPFILWMLFLAWSLLLPVGVGR